MNRPLFIATLILVACSTVGDGTHPLVVHEWGTFTSLQDEQGQSIGGINVEDEVVPDFVHELKANLLVRPERLAPVFYKGAPRVHPDVTLRLETPVVYFHPEPGRVPLEVDVQATFHGGWLTQYYPSATPHSPGLDSDRFRFGSLDSETRSSLTWEALVIGGQEDSVRKVGPPTDEPVWLAPRQVEAEPVTTAEGESEGFLFYRGVAHLDAPLQVSSDASGTRIEIRARAGDWTLATRWLIARAWLVDVDERGLGTAFRTLQPFELELGGEEGYVATLDFSTDEYSAGNLERLRDSMHAELVRAGLFEDEARALLETWRHSYFDSPGRRLFFLVPRKWTDHHLPLSISTPTELVRVMVGRIELVIPEQRRRLEEIGAGPTSPTEWVYDLVRDSGSSDLEALVAGSPEAVPSDYALYRSLGRFANALVLDELARRPTSGLRAFVETYGLQGHRRSVSE